MIRKIGFVFACLICVQGLYAQDGSTSPYSYFGLGDIRESSTVENQMMGGIGMYADSIHISLNNPAAYGSLGVQVRDNFSLTTYTAGISHKQLRYKTYGEEQSSSITNLDYLALGVGLKKGLGLGFGIRPYTSVGYNFETLEGVEGSRTLNQYSGKGGLNKVFVSVGYEIVKNLSLGVTVNYNFGTLEREVIQSRESVQFGSRDIKSSRINGVDLNYAVNYTPAINDTHTLYTSLRINTQANLSARNIQETGSYSLATGQNISVDQVDLQSMGLKETGVKIPTTTTLGLGYGENMKWFLGVEYSIQKLEDLSNEFLEFENLVYDSATTVALGGFFTPDRNSFDSYFKRVTYRAGFRYSETGMIINDKDVKNLGITFGVGLPLGNYPSNLNLGFELGRRGTSASNLVEESYFKVNVGLSLNDQWFQKRKIN